MDVGYQTLEEWAVSQWGVYARFISKAVFAIAIILLAILISKLLVKLIHERLGGRAGQVTVFVTLTRVTVWLAAALVLCEPLLGIQPAAIAAALGVGSLIISLGLQDTISNVIGGIQLTTHKVISPGDHIELGEYRGQVLDITWRNTTIIDTEGNIEVIPNASLNKTTVKVLNEKNGYKHCFDILVRPLVDLDAVGEDIVAAADAVLEEGGWQQPGYPSEVMFLDSSAYGVRASVRVFLKEEDMTVPAIDAVMRALKQKPYLSDVTSIPVGY